MHAVSCPQPMLAERDATRQEPPAVSFDHAYGALLGNAVGDAAGAVLEFSQFDAEDVRRAMRMPGGGVFKVGPGQITDDTELLLALATSLVHRDPTVGLPLDPVAAAYNAWRASSPFDMGRTCRVAFGASCPGSMMRQALNNSADSQANGALMRVAPVAIWTAGSPFAQGNSRGCPRRCTSFAPQQGQPRCECPVLRGHLVPGQAPWRCRGRCGSG